jgi:hypothetical protein
VAHHLTARCAVASEDAETDYFRVGLAENPDFTGWYLMFHGGPADPTATLPDEDYLLHTESGAFTFGGLTGVKLVGRVLHLRFSDPAAADLELPDPHLEIILDVDTDSLGQLSDGLARVFAGTSSTNRPSRIHLPGTDVSAYGSRRREHRQPRSARVEFDVIGQTGHLVTVQPVDATGTRRQPAEHLAARLRVDPTNLIGTRFSCLVTPGTLGPIYTDFRLIQR